MSCWALFREKEDPIAKNTKEETAVTDEDIKEHAKDILAPIEGSLRLMGRAGYEEYLDAVCCKLRKVVAEAQAETPATAGGL